MKKQFLLLCTSAFIVLSACSKAGERGETGSQGPQGLPGQDLAAKQLFSFDTTGGGVKAVKITSATFKNGASNAVLTNIVADVKKVVQTGAANQLKASEVGDDGKTLTLEVKELTTAVADAIGIAVPFEGEGIKAGATISVQISGKDITDDNADNKTTVGIGFANGAVGTSFAAANVEAFSTLTLSADKKGLLTQPFTVPISKKGVKVLFFQITAEDASKKLFAGTKAQVDIAISVKDGQHIDTKHIILKGVAAS